MIALAPELRSPYSLNSQPGFYATLSQFANQVLAASEEIAGTMLDGHMALQLTGDPKQVRSRGEYAIELLTLGVLRIIYGNMALSTSNAIIRRLWRLWIIRSKDSTRKNDADNQRANLFNSILRQNRQAINQQDDSKLCAWLMATGEFQQEAFRIETWLSEIGVFWTAEELIRCSDDLAAWFIMHSQETLGAWTQGVNPHIQKIVQDDSTREDLLLITRPEPLYHLNMIGAEIMNRAFKDGFDARPHKVLLVPGCMRSRSGKECRATQKGLDIECTSCQADCEVSRLNALGREQNFSVRIVPHASSFTAWLEHWQKNSQTALIAAACPLHLVPGGYEMRALGLMAQCILLDYSGCQRHWDAHGIPTRFSHERLLQVLQANCP